MTTHGWRAEYWNMVDRWRTIVAQSRSDKEKRESCHSILEEHIGRLALYHAGRKNPTLRFWAAMFRLKEQLAPGPGCNDDLARLAVFPAFGTVYDWVRSHRHGHHVEWVQNDE